MRSDKRQILLTLSTLCAILVVVIFGATMGKAVDKNGLHTIHYATQLRPHQKELILDSLRSYYSGHPYSFHRLAKFMIGVSAMTLWRIVNEKTERISQKSLYHIYHFLTNQSPYSVIQKQLRNGNWIRFSPSAKVKFY